jgi:hypothetical protein
VFERQLPAFMIGFPHLFPLNEELRETRTSSPNPEPLCTVFPSATTGYCSGAFDKVESITVALMSSMLSKTMP